jgi:hypothetical protein
MTDPHLRRIVSQNLERLLPPAYNRLSAASVADLMTNGIVSALDATASYAYHVHDSKIQAVWEGAKALGRE